MFKNSVGRKNNDFRLDGEPEEPDKTGSKGSRWKDEATRRLNSKKNLSEAKKLLEMEKIQSWNFTGRRMAETGKKSWFRSALSWIAVGVGKTAGKLLNFFLTLPWVWKLNAFRRSGELENLQARTENQIPGWEDTVGEDGQNQKKDELNVDFRRVPAVWSHLTAAKAEDSKGRPLDPVITIYADQPVKGSSQTMNGRSAGHTYLGIEYSRFSRKSNRFERYSTEFGMHEVTDIGRTFSGAGMMLNRNARLPARLDDDSEVDYDVSRRYPAKNEQVNAIFEASEHYADKGYNIYDRNCNTFVKEMVVDTAHLAIGGEIFKQSQIEFSSLANMALFGANAAEMNFEAGMQTNFMKYGAENDMTYSAFGNKIATREDYENYRESIENESGGESQKWTFTPAETGENMRRTSGSQSGELGSRKFMGDIKNADNLVQVFDEVDRAGDDLERLIRSVVPLNTLQDAPDELTNIINSLHSMGSSFRLSHDIRLWKKVPSAKAEAKRYSPEKIRKSRQEASGNIKRLNLMLTKYFANDTRLHMPVMDMISLMNHGIRRLDEIYSLQDQGQNAAGDLKDIRSQMANTKIQVRSGNTVVEISPSHYESYLQIFKTPRAAVAAYAKFKRLERKTRLTKEEQKELDKCEKIDYLADDFDKSHNYLLEKDKYSQRDVDYVFQLHKKERVGEGANSLGVKDYKSASAIYMSLLFDNIFGNLRSKWTRDAKKRGNDLKNPGNAGSEKAWLDTYLNDNLKKHREEMTTILREIKRAAEQPDEDNIFESFTEYLSKSWLAHMFSREYFKPQEIELKTGAASAVEGYNLLMEDNTAAFPKTIKDLIRRIFDGDDLIEAD